MAFRCLVFLALLYELRGVVETTLEPFLIRASVRSCLHSPIKTHACVPTHCTYIQ